MKRKSVLIKFARALPWSEAVKLQLGLDIAYVMRAGEPGIQGIYCIPEERPAVAKLLRQAKIELADDPQG